MYAGQSQDILQDLSKFTVILVRSILFAHVTFCRHLHFAPSALSLWTCLGKYLVVLNFVFFTIVKKKKSLNSRPGNKNPCEI